MENVTFSNTDRRGNAMSEDLILSAAIKASDAKMSRFLGVVVKSCSKFKDVKCLRMKEGQLAASIDGKRVI